MRRCSFPTSQHRNFLTSHGGVAFLWDESFLWGIMAYKALKSLNLPFEPIRAEDIRAGVLKNYKMLFVPGGWASNKSKALSNKGVKAIKNFIRGGGNYLGICGGAGLATLDGIGLLNVRRKPTKERVPSFSGRIYLNINKHPIWHIEKEAKKIRSLEVEKKIIDRNFSTSPPHNFPTSIFHAWWPSQLLVKDNNIRVLATYGDALPDAFSSDLNVADVQANGGWKRFEEIYQINLNPERLKNEPAVVEGNFGKGKVILSLIHFDTPGDINGQMVLKNLWEYLTGLKSERKAEVKKIRSYEDEKKILTSQSLNFLSSSIEELETAVTGLINLGERNFLWFRRNPMLLQWRRGIRGLEYNTLYIMIKEISKTLKRQNRGIEDKKIKRWEDESISISQPLNLLTSNALEADLRKIRDLLIPFVEKAKQLLILERHVMQNGHITYERCNDPEIQQIRTELFSDSKHHGGMFKELIDEIDCLLFSLMKQIKLKQ